MGAHRGLDERRRLVREWERSSLTAVAFGKLHGIRPATLRTWARALRGPTGSRSRRGRPRVRGLEFLEVPAPVTASPASEVRVEIACGARRLTCTAAFTATDLAALVRALEDQA